MTDREMLVELIEKARAAMKKEQLSCDLARNFFFAEYLLNNGVTVQAQWISCEERLPKRRGHYFISYIFDDYEEMPFYGAAMFHPEMDADNGLVKRPHFSNEGVEGMRVTHWMRIPPKGVE